ncbi:unnamed protein product [Effrenium voratum]|nr:unnamed protein product [Effrenium voratum]
MLKDSLQLQALQSLLKPFRRSHAGALHGTDLDRAALAAELWLELAWQALRGGREVAVSARPHGLLLQASDFYRFAARWGYTSLLNSGEERLVMTVAFMVAGLHLAAAGFPHPSSCWDSSIYGRQTVLLEDCQAQIDVGHKRSSFEVTGRGFRIHGTEEVTCRLRLPGSFCFADRGWTTVEFSEPAGSVRFTMPELCVGPSGYTFGAGSVFRWQGTSTFTADDGTQCVLHFGKAGKDDVQGVVRDRAGAEARQISGRWLGPLHCDDEVIWRGPG